MTSKYETSKRKLKNSNQQRTTSDILASASLEKDKKSKAPQSTNNSVKSAESFDKSVSNKAKDEAIVQILDKPIAEDLNTETFDEDSSSRNDEITDVFYSIQKSVADVLETIDEGSPPGSSSTETEAKAAAVFDKPKKKLHAAQGKGKHASVVLASESRLDELTRVDSGHSTLKDEETSLKNYEEPLTDKNIPDQDELLATLMSDMIADFSEDDEL